MKDEVGTLITIEGEDYRIVGSEVHKKNFAFVKETPNQVLIGLLPSYYIKKYKKMELFGFRLPSEDKVEGVWGKGDPYGKNSGLGLYSVKLNSLLPAPLLGLEYKVISNNLSFKDVKFPGRRESVLKLRDIQKIILESTIKWYEDLAKLDYNSRSEYLIKIKRDIKCKSLKDIINDNFYGSKPLKELISRFFREDQRKEIYDKIIWEREE